MADVTGISWTDHTFNPWWGCTRIAPGCDNCYAATFDKRTGGDYWNPKIDPRLTSVSNWNKPKKWNRLAEESGIRKKVFCGSMMDWCDNDAPDGALDRLWAIINETPRLDWQLLTKRSTLIEKKLPSDWGCGYDNVWLGVTVEDMEYGYKRIEDLNKIPAKVSFLSCEPLLEKITDIKLSNIDWVIIGGESGPNFRPMEKDWVNQLIYEARIESVPVWFKQWGGNQKDKGGSLIYGEELKQWPTYLTGEKL